MALARDGLNRADKERMQVAKEWLVKAMALEQKFNTQSVLKDLLVAIQQAECAW